MDFSKLKYDVTKVGPGKLVTKVYPDLLDFKEYQDPADDQLLRIAFLSYDDGSPFLKKHRDNYEERLSDIFEFLDIDDDTLLKQLLLNENKPFAAIVNRMFMQTDNLAYVTWSNMVLQFHYITLALRQPPNLKDMLTDMKNRAQLQNMQSELHQKIVDYEAQIFADAIIRKVAREKVVTLLQVAESHADEKQVI